MLLMLAPLTLLLGWCPEAPGEEPLKPELVAEIKVAPHGAPIVLPVTFRGKTYRFLMDTGTPFTTFHTDLEDLLGKPKHTYRAEMADGTVNDMNVYYAPEATIGKVSLSTGGPVHCVDLTEWRGVIGIEIDGVVGMGLLRRYAVQIDFDNGKVRFYKSDDKDHSEWGQAATLNTLPRRGLPYVVGNLADQRATFLLDTGYGDTGSLDLRLFDLLKKQEGFRTVSVKLMGGDEEARESVASRVDAFRLGKNEYKGLVFDRGERASMLGLGFLSRHMVTFDFPRLKLYLKPGRDYNKVDENDMSGLHLLKKSSGILVDSVDSGSPSALAGMRPGDVLLQIDDKDVRQQSLWKIRRLLRGGDGRKTGVIFRRGDKRYRTSFQLKKLI
jgi:hypothetical protein